MSHVLTDIFDLLEFNTNSSQNIAWGKTAAWNQRVQEQRETTQAYLQRALLPAWEFCAARLIPWLCSASVLAGVQSVRLCACHSKRLRCQSVKSWNGNRSGNKKNELTGIYFVNLTYCGVMDPGIKDTSGGLPFVCGQPDNHASSLAAGKRGPRARRSEHPAFGPSHPLGWRCWHHQVEQRASQTGSPPAARSGSAASLSVQWSPSLWYLRNTHT